MKKTISNVVNFPNGCETVRYTACFTSMIMRADNVPASSEKHEEMYNLYNAAAGFAFLQIDLSNDEHMSCDWNQTCNVMLRKFDWYIGFSMDYAGYDFDELIFPESDKASVFAKIKASVDRDVPVLALFGRLYQWVLITGYDDGGAVYGLDGSRGYWGAPIPKPASYDEDGLFYMPDWYENGGHAFVLGEKRAPTVTTADIFKRGVKIMESMREQKFYANSVDFMLDNANFENLTDDELLKMRSRIAAWIGQPIDQRAMLGYAMNPLRESGGYSTEILRAFDKMHGLCWTMHDVLWIAWRALGEYADGNRLDFARGLRNKTIRRMIADCVAFVRDHDEYMLEDMKSAFDKGE